MNDNRVRFIRVLIILSVVLVCAGGARAQVLSTLHSFAGTDGSVPSGILVQGPDGTLYGTSYSGGANNDGTIFKISSGIFSTLYSFGGWDGKYPTAGLLLARDGNLYGTTSAGGFSNDGTVFRISTTGAFSKLFSFSGFDGNGPSAPLVQGIDGTMYGTTDSGGASGKGTAFLITKTGFILGWYSFSGSDGASPVGGLLTQYDDPNSILDLPTLYGTTSDGGANGLGTVYSIDAFGVHCTLYSFSGPNGATPDSGLLAYGGSLYGTTSSGGPSHFGTIFQLTGNVLSTLHAFDGADGGNPTAGLILGADGNFYGATTVGPNGDGTLFNITPAGALTSLYSFAGPDGVDPSQTLMQGADGNFYGVTSGGGASNDGTVFELQVPPAAPIALTATTGNSQVSLAWTASATATSYNVYRGTAANGEGVTPIATGLTAVAYVDNSATSGGTYYYTVAGVSGGGTSPMSNEASATLAPSAPSDLTATAGQSLVNLSWTASVGATSYNLYRSTAASGEGTTPVETDVTGVTYSDTGLTDGTTYFYTATAVNAGGQSGQSNEASATPQPPTPPVPTTLAATPGNALISLLWSPSSGATSYIVYRGTSAGGESVTSIASGLTGISYTDTGVSNSTTYFYKVAAANAFGTSGLSTEASATPEPPIPAAPSGLTATGANTVVGLSWTISPYATSYAVYRGTSAGGEGAAPIAAAVTGNTYVDSGLTIAVTYYYYITATGISGTSGHSIEASGKASGPPPPAILSAVGSTVGGSTVTLTWTSALGATSYNVVRSTVHAQETAYVNGLTGLTYVDTNVVNGTIYYYRVVAVNAAGAGWSSEVSADPVPVPPAPTALVATSGITIALNWASAVGATSYCVYRSTLSGGESTTPVYTGVLGTHFTDSGVAGGTAYYYQVSAVNGSGTSRLCAEARALTVPSPPVVTAEPGNAQFRLTFTGITGATSFNVYRATSTGTEGTTPYAAGVGAAGFLDTAVSNGITYFYTATALNTVGMSAQSTEVSGTPSLPPGGATGLTAIGSNGQVALSWATTSGATSYTILRSTVHAGETQYLSGITGTSYVDTAVSNGTTYYYRVIPVNVGGDGVESVEVSATP